MIKYSLFLLFIQFFTHASAQKYYHADSAITHFYPKSELIESACLPLNDTSIVQIHTWNYYQPGQVIFDSTYIDMGRVVRKQKLYNSDSIMSLSTKFVYCQDTVDVTHYWRLGTFEYSTVKMTTFDHLFISDYDLNIFGWATAKNLSGQITNSYYNENTQVLKYKEYYDNGQLKQHEYFENGKFRRISYKKNGKKKKDKRYHIRRHIHMIDSTDVTYRTSNGSLISECMAENDTSIVKKYTWANRNRHQAVEDTSYLLNGTLVREQRLYLPYHEKNISNTYIFRGDTVYCESYWEDLTRYSQAIKTKIESEYEYHTAYGINWDYQKFGWSIDKHKNGYISDSTFYEGNEAIITKRFYESGQLEYHRRPADEGFETTEYKRNGKVRRRINSTLMTSYITTALVIALAAVIR